MKLLFAPVRMLSGILAGITGKKLFARLWAIVDDAEPPKPEQRGTTWPKLIAALLLEGAIFRVVRGATDHAARRGFAHVTGSWPGKKR
ncbi:MAG TPA: DUF4235 domain-containing protein [Solirubrobacteraceae bacterium]|jgi:hypothetical protein